MTRFFTRVHKNYRKNRRPEVMPEVEHQPEVMPEVEQRVLLSEKRQQPGAERSAPVKSSALSYIDYVRENNEIGTRINSKLFYDNYLKFCNENDKKPFRKTLFRIIVLGLNSTDRSNEVLDRTSVKLIKSNNTFFEI